MAQYKTNIWHIYAYDSEGDLCYLVRTRTTDIKDRLRYTTTFDVTKSTVYNEYTDAEEIIEKIQKGIIDLYDEMINAEDLKVCYFNENCVCDFKTDKQIEFYGDDDDSPNPSKYQNESMSIREALDILENKGYILEKTENLPQFDSDEEQEFKTMLSEFWPYYCGAVDMGKTGLSSNPKAQRRNDKIYSFLKTIFGDYTYNVNTGFNVYLQDVQGKFEKDIINENPDYLGNISPLSNLGVYKLSKKTCPMVLDYIDKMDANALAKKFIEEN